MFDAETRHVLAAIVVAVGTLSAFPLGVALNRYFRKKSARAYNVFLFSLAACFLAELGLGYWMYHQ